MKTNLDQFYKMDETSEKTGVWMEISEETGFLVRPFKASNPKVKKALDRYHKPHARQMLDGTLPPEKMRKIMVTAFVHASLENWKGIEIDGKETPYSPEIAIEFLTALPELFSAIQEFASDFKNFKADEEVFDADNREALGNS